MHEEEVFDSSKVVNFQVPHNAAVQIYDFKSKKSRVQFGPELVSLVKLTHIKNLIMCLFPGNARS